MMIRSGRVPGRGGDDGPPASRPLYIVSIVLIAAWVVVLAVLLVGLMLRFL
jgi:hypothetical protein